MKSKAKTNPAILSMATVAEAALALRVSRATVRNMLRDGRLPHVRLGTGDFVHVRIDVESFLRANAVPAAKAARS